MRTLLKKALLAPAFILLAALTFTPAFANPFNQPSEADEKDRFVKNLEAYIHFAKRDLTGYRYWKIDDVFANGAYFVRVQDRTGGRRLEEIQEETYEKVLALVCENGIKEQSIKLGIPIVLMIVDHKKVPQSRKTFQMSDCQEKEIKKFKL